MCIKTKHVIHRNITNTYYHNVDSVYQLGAFTCAMFLALVVMILDHVHKDEINAVLAILAKVYSTIYVVVSWKFPSSFCSLNRRNRSAFLLLAPFVLM